MENREREYKKKKTNWELRQQISNIDIPLSKINKARHTKNVHNGELNRSTRGQKTAKRNEKKIISKQPPIEDRHVHVCDYKISNSI